MVWDIIIIGAGPGGLQAAIAGASEGLKVLVIEKAKAGGQIGQTPKLENSVFAAGGITGPQFADMMYKQAMAMGVEFMSGRASNLAKLKTAIAVYIEGRDVVQGHTAIIAVGNKWREIELPGIEVGVKRGDIRFGPVGSINFQGQGGFAAVYGGGPAAGQAILALADNTSLRGVHAFMRSNLNMPEYLAERIRKHPRVRLVEQTTLVETSLNRGGHGINVTTQRATDAPAKVPVEALFLCNGLLPDTDWLTLDKAENGQIITGKRSRNLSMRSSLETSEAGVYAIGDCREGSTPRVGSAIGEGSMAITEIWTYFRNNPVCAICPKLLGKKAAV